MAEAPVIQEYCTSGGALVWSRQVPAPMFLSGNEGASAVVTEEDDAADLSLPSIHYEETNPSESKMLAQGHEHAESSEPTLKAAGAFLGEVVVDALAETVSPERGAPAVGPNRGRNRLPRSERAVTQTLAMAQMLFGQPITTEQTAPFREFMDTHVFGLYAARAAGDYKVDAETACRMLRLHMDGWKQGEIKTELNDDSTTGYAHTRKKFVEILTRHITSEQLWQGFEEFMTEGRSSLLAGMVIAGTERAVGTAALLTLAPNGRISDSAARARPTVRLLSSTQIAAFYERVGTVVGPRDWQDLALCNLVDPVVFYPMSPSESEAPKSVCGRCLVKSECLADALSADGQLGIRAGLSDRQRLRLKRRANGPAF